MIQFSCLNDLPNLRHGFLDRRDGTSTGIYTSLNCGPGSDDDPAKVTENRERALARAGLPAGSLVTAYQVHSAEVRFVDQKWPEDNRPKIDGMVTTRPGISLGILTADCAPVLFADPEAGIIGAAHAGWRGAITGVIEATVKLMEEQGARIERIRAAIGPTIAQRSYEVGAEFPALFLAENASNERWFVPGRRAGHYQFDLKGYLEQKLRMLGLGAVEVAPHDTCAEEQLFFSYRRSTLRGEPDYGRQLSVIGLI